MDCEYCGTIILENGAGAHHSASCPIVRIAELEKDYKVVEEALKDLMGWQVKNVKLWHNSAYDSAQRALDKVAAKYREG